MDFYYISWTFIIGSIFGWIVEVIFAYLKTKTFQNRSSLIYGPWGCAYGIGAVGLNLLLSDFNDSSILTIFLVSFIVCTISEYIMSWGMELVIGFCVWDYSKRMFNINGRVCLLYSVFWGFLGIIWCKIIKNILNYMIASIPYKLGLSILKIIVIFFIIDAIISLVAVIRSNNRKKGKPAKTLVAKFFDQFYSDEFLKKVYPQMFEYRGV